MQVLGLAQKQGPPSEATGHCALAGRVLGQALVLESLARAGQTQERPILASSVA